MILLYFYVFFFAFVVRVSQAFHISSKQSNFTITVRYGNSGVFGNETIDGKVDNCYPLQKHKIPSVVHLNETSSLPNYIFNGYSGENCDECVVTKPFKPNVPIFLNERNSICSFILGKQPRFQVTIVFTHESNSTNVTVDNTNCYDICNNDESYHYPYILGIYEESGNDANNFVRLYSESGCMIDNIITHRDGSEEIKTGDDLFELSRKDQISVVGSFTITTMAGELCPLKPSNKIPFEGTN